MEDIIEINIVNHRDYFKVFNLILKNIHSKVIKINIKLSFLEPKDVLLITQSIIFLKNNDCKVYLSSKSTLSNYLKDISLIDFCKTNYKTPNTIKAISSLSAMPIRRVEQDNMNEYITRTQEYFQTICDNADLTMLNLCLSELINNVYNHSHSQIGAYVFCQFYPKKNEIKIAVSDLGIGIPESINNFRLTNKKIILSSKDCVKWALEENNTTQSIPQNMGKGLDTINSFVSSNLGSWELFTNGVRLCKYPSSSNRYNDNPIINFKGTLIQIIIKVNNLENLEIIDNFDW
jgi:hypothetical protein